MGLRRANDAVVASLLSVSRSTGNSNARRLHQPPSSLASIAQGPVRGSTAIRSLHARRRRAGCDGGAVFNGIGCGCSRDLSQAVKRGAAAAAAYSTTASTSTSASVSAGARNGQGNNVEGQAPSIAIVGGGLTGLTAAYYLARELPANARVTLLEGGARLGGWIKTDKVDVDVGGVRGVVSFERGPRTLSSLSRSTWRFDDLILYDLAVNLGLKLHMPPDRPRYLYYPDHLVPLPPATSLSRFLQEPLFLDSIIPALGFLIRRLRPFRPDPPSEDISVSEWVRLITGGRTLADNAVSAMIHGIYGGDVDRLSARSVLESMFYAYHLPLKMGPGMKAMPLAEQQLMEAMAGDEQVRRLALKPKGSLIHFGGEAGMESLPIALADALRGQPNVELRLNEPVIEMNLQEDMRLEVISSRNEDCHRETFDKVIATIPSQALATITPHLTALHDLDAVSIMTVNLWYPSRNIKPPGVGYLIPRSVPEELNPERALGVFFDSDVGLTGGPAEPRGTKLFILMGGHYYDPFPSPFSSSSSSSSSSHKTIAPPTPDQAVDQAKAVVERHLGIPRSTPCFAMARLAQNCIPQHRVGHLDVLGALAQQLSDTYHGRLAVAGGSYTKIGAMGAMRGGYDIARAVLDEVADEWFSGTGLEWLDDVGQTAVLPASMIPVRRFGTQPGM